MTELRLTDTTTHESDATLLLQPDGTVTATGEGADAARAILDSAARVLQTDDAAAFRFLHRTGWSNGVLALLPPPEVTQP
jgi:hypothetical protein